MYKKLREVAQVGLISLITGCAAPAPQYQMVKQGASAQEQTQDQAFCQMQANSIQTADWEYRDTFLEGANIQKKQRETFSLCMTSRGYTSVPVR